MNRIRTYFSQKQHLALLTILLIAGVLRLYALNMLPPGLYIDEVSIGNNAYAILTQGVDEHNVSFPLWFKAFGEYKMPIMIYLVSLSMGIMGKSDIAVRIPSAIMGIITVFALYELLRLLTIKSKDTLLKYIPLIGAGLLAITPWHVHFSRGGFEATIALGILLVSLCFFVYATLSKRQSFFLAASVCLALTMYAYNTYRITAVVLMIFFLLYTKIKHTFTLKQLIITSIVFLVMSLPMIQFSLSPEGSERFRQTSAFSTYTKLPLTEQVRLIPMDFLKNYLTYFSPEFLFAVGDQNGRHQIPGFGLLYRISLPFFALGLYVFWKRKRDLLTSLTLLLVLLAPLPAALTIPSPHALRSLPLVIPMIIMTSFGVARFWLSVVKHKRIRVIGTLLIVSILLFEGSYYLHLGTQHYPRVNALDWGAGYKQILQKAESFDGYAMVAIDSNIGNIKPYVQFYTPAMHYEIVTPDWVKPPSLQGKKVLFIRPDYHQLQKEGLVGTVQLDDVNKYTFAEFYAL